MDNKLYDELWVRAGRNTKIPPRADLCPVGILCLVPALW
jgi:hypothetical protein